MATLTPVDYDPFAGGNAPAAAPAAAPAGGPKLTPVDYDPFASAGQNLPDVGGEGGGGGGGLWDKLTNPTGFSAGYDWANKPAQAVSESVGKAATNLPHSAYQFGANIGEAALHPIDTATGLGHLVAGVGQKLGIPGNEYEKYADAAGQAIMERYGSLEKAQHTFETDPVGFAADISGALGLAGKVARVSGLAKAAVRAPTTPELFDAAQGHYQAAHGFGVEFKPSVATDMAQNIENALRAGNSRDYLAPNAWRAFDELRQIQGPVQVSDIDGVRQLLNEVRQSADPKERRAAAIAIGEIDDAMTKLRPQDAIVNPHFVPRINEEIKLARGDYRAAAQARKVETATTTAERQAASTGSGANIDNATRQKFRAILASPSKQRGWTKSELADMDQIVRGTFTGNAARLVGKLAPTGVVSGALSATLGHVLGHTLGVPALGMGAKALSDAITTNNAARLSEKVRLRSPEARRIGATAAPPLWKTAARNVYGPARRLNLAGQNPANPYPTASNPYGMP
jgi:hypothetical protein